MPNGDQMTTDTAEWVAPFERPVVLERAWRVVGISAGVGALTTALTFATVVSGEPTGVGMALAVIAIAALIVNGRHLVGEEPSRLATVFAGLAALFGVLLAARSSPTLTTLNLLAAGVLLVAAVVAYRAIHRPETYLISMLGSGVALLVDAAVEPIQFVATDIPAAVAFDRSRTLRIALGALLALPVIGVLGALLGSADQIFADVLSQATTMRPWLMAAALLTLMVTWVVAGGARSVARGRQPVPIGIQRPVLPLESAAVVVGSATVVLVLFDIIQVVRVFLAYAAEAVSYADEARSGFFELTAVTAVVLGLILITDWATNPPGHPRSPLLSRLHWSLIALTLPVIASALVRLVVYIHAFGLTQLRGLTTAGVLWMAAVLVWSGLTVIAGRRHRFIAPAAAGLLALLLLINIINFDARIAQVNLAVLGQQPLDNDYLSTGLSADAVPAVVSHVLNSPDPCVFAGLVDRLTIETSSDVRSWNVGRARTASRLDVVREAIADCRRDH